MHWQTREQVIEIRSRVREAIAEILEKAEQEIKALEEPKHVQFCEV